MSLSRVDVLDDGAAVALHFDDGTRHRFHAIWLRDNALDDVTRAANGQKLLRLRDLPTDVSIAAARITDTNELAIIFGPDDHHTCFPGPWLLDNAYDRLSDRQPGWLSDGVCLWRGSDGACPQLHDAAQMRPGTVAHVAMLDDIVTTGFAIVRGCATEPDTIFDLADLIGPVRETNYGRLFDVRAEVNPVNLAYSGLGLQAHTDNPYRDPVPTVQILQCLRNSVEGGDSSVVDGFAVATHLRAIDPAAFDILATYPVRYRYNGDSISDLQSRRPIIQLNPDGELIGIRFNNRSAAPFTDIPFDQMSAFYRAYRAFADIVDDPAMARNFRLDPGMAFIVDNRRVMHSRTAFSGTGERWLQGCYADMDSVRSKLAVFGEKILHEVDDNQQVID